MFNLSKKRIISALFGVAASISLVACSSAADVADTATPAATASSTTSAETTSAEATADVAAALAANLEINNISLDYDEASAEEVALTDSGAEITAAGVYRLSGTTTDGQITVNSTGDGTVYLILDGVDVTSATSAALNVVDAEDVVIVLAEGSTNTLTDASDYTTGEDGPTGALYSTADLTIAGDGALSVTGNYNDGIVGKDGLIIAAGDITVTAVDDGIRGKDYLVIAGGSVTVAAQGDGLKADNEEDATAGFIYISDGTLDVTAGDDGMQAMTDVIIGGGTIAVAAADDGIKAEVAVVQGGGDVTVSESTEGVEGNIINISAGELDVTASDDGLNAPSTTGVEVGNGGDGELYISGGNITIDADSDGIDSNGFVEMSGGNVTIYGPTTDREGALDANLGVTMTGGTLLAGGSNGMVLTPSAGGQSFVSITGNASAGQSVEVQDSSGNVVATYTAEKNIGNLVVSVDGMTDGETYTMVVDGEAVGTGTAGEEAAGGPAGGAPGGGGGAPRR